MRAFILILITLLAAPTFAQDSDKDSGPIRVLFVGNSYTSFNNLPGIVQSLAVSAKQKRPIEYEMITPGGCTWERHFNDERIGTLEKIKSQKWDYVVMQEQSQMPFMYPDDAHKFGVLLGKAVQEQGATPLLYMTWARESQPKDKAEREKIHVKIRDTYRRVAEDLEAPCAPAGVAWWTVLGDKPAIKLFNKDGSHPSPTGSFLSACVIYATIYDRSPQGLTGKHLFKKDGKTYMLCNVPDIEAGYLEKIAWEAVKAEKDRKKAAE